MALPTSGPLSFSAINTELGRSSTAQMSLQTAETGGYVAINPNSASRPNGSAPYAVSEWYGYNQSAGPASYSYPFSSSSSTNTNTACGYYFGLSLYSSSSSLYSGLTMYSNAALTTVFNGGNVYRKGQNNSVYRITTSGVITVIIPC
jgi:hypothetical protein